MLIEDITDKALKGMENDIAQDKSTVAAAAQVSSEEKVTTLAMILSCC